MADDVSAADALTEQAEEANEAAIDAREDEQNEPETEEEYYARIEAARATGIFGDTPTDPTTGDVAVPVSDEEAGTAAASEVDAAAEEGDEEAQDQTPGQAKRQASDSALTDNQLEQAEEDSDERNADDSDDE